MAVTPRPTVTAEELAHDIMYLAVKLTNRTTDVARLRRVQAYLVRQIQAVESERTPRTYTGNAPDDAQDAPGGAQTTTVIVRGGATLLRDSGASEGQGR